jgi:hypothetical protein
MSAASNLIQPISRLPDPDMQAAPAALVRAAQRARELAARTHTPLVITKNGKLVEETIESDIAVEKLQRYRPSTA